MLALLYLISCRITFGIEMGQRRIAVGKIAFALGAVCVVLAAGFAVLLAEYVFTVRNQESQIRTLTDQVSQLRDWLNGNWPAQQPDFDSGWINITDKCGQYFNVTHNLDSTDVVVDITGKTTIDGEVERYLGLTDYQLGWNKTYGTADISNATVPTSIIQTGDGGFALAGSTDAMGGAQHRRYWLMKTDANGEMLWNQTYGGTSTDQANCAIQTSDGGYAIVGTSSTYGGCAWLVKTDSSGIMQWNKTYFAGVIWTAANSLVQTTDEGYALAGLAGTNNNDFVLVKTDASGNLQWNKTYGGAYEDVCNSLAQTTDAGYILAGYTRPYPYTNSSKAWLVKTDSYGSVQWNKTYGGPDWDGAWSIIQTNDGGYAFGGTSTSLGDMYGALWLVKTDASGNARFSKTYGLGETGIAYVLIQTSDGGYAIEGGGAPSLVKTDSYGNLQFKRTFPTNFNSGNSVYKAAVQTKDGAFALTYVYSNGTGASPCLLKTDSEYGLAQINYTANNITLYRGATDPYWNFVRVRIWKP
jgi:hypothetical protein